MITHISDTIVNSIKSKYGDSLTKINLSKNGLLSIKNVGELSNQLERLNLSQNRLTDISPLATITSLTQLNISENSIKCLDGLEQLVNLEVLNISHNCLTDCETLAPLKALKSLHDLSLVGNPICSSVDYENTVFSYLPELHYLDGLSRDCLAAPLKLSDVYTNAEMLRKTSQTLNAAGDLRPRHEELISKSERSLFLEARILSMERAFALQEEALANGNQIHQTAQDPSSVTHSIESSIPYLQLLRLWRNQAHTSMTQLILVQSALQKQGSELKAQRVTSADALREAQLTVLSWKERSLAADDKARSFEAIIARLQTDIDEERQKVKVAQNESLNARKSESSMRTLLLESVDKLQEHHLGATLTLEQGVAKLNVLKRRVMSAAERVDFSAALVAQREVHLRNSMAMHALTSGAKGESENEILIDIPQQSDSISDLARNPGFKIRPEAESLLRNLFTNLDESGRGVVSRELLLLCLGDEGSERGKCDFNISSLTSLIGDVLGKPQLDQAIIGLRSVKTLDLTWGEFLLQMVCPGKIEHAVPLTEGEYSELGRSGAWGDAQWGLIPLNIPNSLSVRSAIFDGESLRLSQERAALLRTIQDLTGTMERRAQICKAHFLRETRTMNLQVTRLQGQVSELTAALVLYEKRYADVNQLHASQRDLLDEKIRALEAELSKLRSKASLKNDSISDHSDNTIVLEKSKYQRMEKEYDLMQREMGRKDVLNKGLERDVKRITVSFNSLMNEKETLESELNACERQLEAMVRTHESHMAEAISKSSALQSDLQNRLSESEARLEMAIENISSQQDFKKDGANVSSPKLECSKSDTLISGLRLEMESIRSIPAPMTVLDSSNGKGNSSLYAAHLERLLRLAEEAIGQ